MNLNQATVVGRVTKDPELRALPSGSKVVNFGVASNRTWKKEDGTKQEEVEFHNVVAFSKLAEIIAQYVKKGQLIMIQGRLKTSMWEKEGSKHYKTEIIAENMQMGPKAANTGGTSEPAATAPAKDELDMEPDPSPAEINPDDVPF